VTQFDSLDFHKDRPFIGDPYSYFDSLREECPVHQELRHGVYLHLEFVATG
jgi:hypothetical protein